MPYFFPKDASAEQINRSTNILIGKESQFWPSADRKFQTPSEHKLKLGFVTSKVNQREVPVPPRFQVDDDLIPRTRRIDNVMDTSLPVLHKKPRRAQPVSRHVEIGSLRKPEVPHIVTPLGVRLEFPERSSEEIGLNAHIVHQVHTKRFPLHLDRVSKFAENFQAILGINPYGNKKMFDSISR